MRRFYTQTHKYIRIEFTKALKIFLMFKIYDKFQLDDPTPMPESALLMATAQIMAEGGAKHSPVNCNTVNLKTDCAASKKAKSGAACFCAAAR